MSLFNVLIHVIICPIPCLGLIKIASVVNLWVTNCDTNQRAKFHKKQHGLGLGNEM